MLDKSWPAPGPTLGHDPRRLDSTGGAFAHPRKSAPRTGIRENSVAQTIDAACSRSSTLSHAVSQDVADDAPDAPPAQIAQHAGMRDSAPARSDGMSELLALVAIMCAKDRQAFRRGCHQQSLSSVDTDVRRSDIRTRAQRGQARFGPPETCSETLRRAFCSAKLHRMTRASHARPAGSGCSGTDPRRSASARHIL